MSLKTYYDFAPTQFPLGITTVKVWEKILNLKSLFFYLLVSVFYSPTTLPQHNGYYLEAETFALDEKAMSLI